MTTFEIISKKRNPIKRYALNGILIAILTLVIIALIGNRLDNTLKIVLMILISCTFIVCLYIINYSVKFKNVIGHISFSEDYIEIEILQKKEIIQNEDIKTIRFKLAGYEGLNNSTVLEYLVWFPSIFSHHSGMNNFVYIYTFSGIRPFEFYLRNKRAWINIKQIEKYYLDNFFNRT